jgi:hypothetical protein
MRTEAEFNCKFGGLTRDGENGREAADLSTNEREFRA